MTSLGIFYQCRAVIITTGTFLKGLIHIGLESFSAGRAGEFPSVGLSDSLRELGLQMGRLKTGTPPRIDSKTIDFTKMTMQWGDDPPSPFSYSTRRITNPQLPCYLTYTNERSHAIIRENLDRSPLYGGKIRGIGPRYCPSIEDKVVRFSDKERHQVFLEPEGLETTEYYANGISTSLPYDVQVKLVRSIAGLKDAEIMRPAYAIEYDFVYPTQLRNTLEVKNIRGIFLAGQINGTSGYEEAAGQGLVAGINAALMLKGQRPLILGRDEAYLGVMIDDLVTKGTREPYRLFTSRAEYRLLLRHDNADFRLREKGFMTGLVKENEYEKFLEKKRVFAEEIARLKRERIKPSNIVNKELVTLGTTPLAEDTTLEKILKRPGICYSFIKLFSPPRVSVDCEIERLLEIQVKYEGYIQKQLEVVGRMKRLESRKLPDHLDYQTIPGLSKEVVERLREVQPETLGQASRIPGVTPAAISLLSVAVERHWKKNY
jgi:tRNA uridine 5-carboxymethylaminomethyl modification enzyme